MMGARGEIMLGDGQCDWVMFTVLFFGLTNVRVNQLFRKSQQRVGHEAENKSGNFARPAISAGNVRASWKAPKQIIQWRPQIDDMQAVALGWPESIIPKSVGNQAMDRPDLQIFPPSGQPIRLQMLEEKFEIRWFADQGFTVIQERQRYHAPAGQPASYLTEHHPIVQLAGWRRRGESNQAVAVGADEGLQPAPSVKHRSARMPVDEVRPPEILEWVDLVNS